MSPEPEKGLEGKISQKTFQFFHRMRRKKAAPALEDWRETGKKEWQDKPQHHTPSLDGGSGEKGSRISTMTIAHFYQKGCLLCCRLMAHTGRQGAGRGELQGDQIED